MKQGHKEAGAEREARAQEKEGRRRRRRRCRRCCFFFLSFSLLFIASFLSPFPQDSQFVREDAGSDRRAVVSTPADEHDAVVL